LLAVEAERPHTGLPQVRDELAGLVRGDVHQVTLWVLRVIGLSRRSEIVVGLRRLEASLLQEVLPIEQAHRARVLGDAPQSAVGVDLRPHPRREGILQCRRRVRGEVKQVSFPQREGVEVLELDLGDVRSTLAGLDRSPQLLVVRGALADVGHIHFDLGVFRRE
jgi:hypothetical protein